MNNTTDSYDHKPTGDQIVVMMIGVIGIVLNTATLIVMLRNFTRIFSNAEASFVTCLSAADLGTNITALLWAAFFRRGQYPFSLLWAILVIMWATVAASFLTLVCMAVERLLVVVNPIKAQRMLKKPFAYICCAVVWTIAVVTSSMCTVDFVIAQFAMVVMFEVSLLVTIGCYVRIYFTMNKLKRDRLRTAARYSPKNAKLKLEVEENEPALHHRVAVRQESRVTNLVFVLILVVVITVLPYMIVLQVAVAHNLTCRGCKRSHSMNIAMDVLFPMEMLNFIINPVLYAWRLPKFRQASKRTFSRFICCKKWQANSDAVAGGNYSRSSSSGSLPNGPATFFTGHDTAGEALNNNRQSWMVKIVVKRSLLNINMHFAWLVRGFVRSYISSKRTETCG